MHTHASRSVMTVCWHAGMLACVLVLSLCGLAQAQQACPPVVTTATTATLGWTPQAQPAGVTVTGYILERKKDTGNWAALPAPPVSATTATDRGLTPGTYTYRLSLTAKLPDGSSITSGYASNDPTHPPCLTVVVVVPPLNLSVTPTTE